MTFLCAKLSIKFSFQQKFSCFVVLINTYVTLSLVEASEVLTLSHLHALHGAGQIEGF